MQPTRHSSARKGKYSTAWMDRRPRTSSNAIKGLLDRQFASISDILAKASQGRDGADIQHKKARKPTAAPTEQVFGLDLPDTLGSAVLKGSDSDTGKSGLEQLKQGLEDGTVSVPRTTMDTTMTADVCEAPHVSLRRGHESNVENDPKKMLAELDRLQKRSSMVSLSAFDISDDPKRMLAEFEKRTLSPSQAIIDNNPRRMLDDLDRNTHSSSRDLHEDDNDDLEVLRSRLVAMLSPSRDRSSHNSVHNGTHMSCFLGAKHSEGSEAQNDAPDHKAIGLYERSIPYAVALELEVMGFKWELVKGWTTYVFSAGLDGQVAQQHKNAIIKRAEEELSTIIQHTMKEELRYREVEERERLPGRIIVSNLAADAGEEDLKQVLYKYRHDTRDITLLNERDPIRRTRIAHVDFSTRMAAVRASYLVGHIFGLCLDIRLAIEELT
ncbi:uncharacterized protein K460DRAFT_112107 [Cucurbitaria berberidis CBS 394.84]|uniref:RRM domain-containing protein n=1 Tax=Cucurbitaria berberidis CBS 394.84 TaxID=1168544 RepID=A0A9P4L8X8_9PLEO|nr:uncharacterized protein K460DRAFT_112107 [Cucurbitaria berberidis CBS 394.84]KAF1845644.1 hypothetical protein K460DRAFT_112107 [Cucurbitaria berberidis CBS 394.84]